MIPALSTTMGLADAIEAIEDRLLAADALPVEVALTSGSDFPLPLKESVFLAPGLVAVGLASPSTVRDDTTTSRENAYLDVTDRVIVQVSLPWEASTLDAKRSSRRAIYDTQAAVIAAVCSRMGGDGLPELRPSFRQADLVRGLSPQDPSEVHVVVLEVSFTLKRRTSLVKGLP